MEREIRVERLLDHAHVMPILNAAPGSSWFVMPLAAGSLEDVVDTAGGPHRAACAIVVLRAASSALGYAHGEGVVRRDVSPRKHPGAGKQRRRTALGRRRFGPRQASRLEPFAVVLLSRSGCHFRHTEQGG